MNLRRKLTITFGVLVLLGLVVAGVSIWATLRWQATNEQLREHYTRSLEVQRIRAATFEASREISDALSDKDPDAEQEFDAALAPAERDFEVWEDLAQDERERRQVEDVRRAYDQLLSDARRFFDLLEAGRRDEAVRLSDETIEETDFDAFKRATEAAVASDRALRDDVRAQTEQTRRTTQLVLILAAFGTVSLLLLMAAYLASDLFRPLRDLRQALEDVGRGGLDGRLDEDRADELGEINRTFNRMVEALAERERVEEDLAADAVAVGGNGSAWRGATSRVTLHRLVSRLRARISQLDGTGGEDQKELTGQLDRLSQAVARITDFGFPLDLNLSRTDVRALLYDVIMRRADELSGRAVSVELDVGPGVEYAVVDRLKLREAVDELLGNALDALPQAGGQVGLRCRLSEDGEQVLIEVADDGEGAEQSLIDEYLDPDSFDDDGGPRVGLALTRAVVEQHGGYLAVHSEPGGGTYAQIRLPLRD